jgi:DNA polymerase-3 subunit delta'
VADVFSSLLGQDRAVAAMRHHAAHPVHAYVLTGPAGSGMPEALRALSAALQCENQGCGACEACRRALAGVDPDVTYVSRAGVSWSVAEFGEAERVSRRKPLGPGHQIVVLENIELAVQSASKLLKVLEEPPTRTIFLLTAESTPEELATIWSRCIEIPFAPLSEDVITDYLVREGADSVAARAAAGASGGDLKRAQVLARDEALAGRVALWQSVPDRLDAVSAHSSQLAEEIIAAIDHAVSPLTELQDGEMESLRLNAREMGMRAVPGRRDVEARFRREQSRFRREDLRFGLATLMRAYRQQMLEGLEGLDDGDKRGRVTVEGAISAIELVDETSRSLNANVNEALVLTNLLLGLARC